MIRARPSAAPALLAPAVLALAACMPGLPDFDARLTDTSRTAAYPTLRPIGTLLAEVDALLPPEAGAGTPLTEVAVAGAAPVAPAVPDDAAILQARAADLRRRAAALRAIPLS